MTHGVRSFARYSSFGNGAARFTSRFRRFLCPLRRAAAATPRIGVSRDRISFAVSCSPVREHRHLFWRLCHNGSGFSALPDDADVALGMERLGACWDAFSLSVLEWR